MRSWKEAIMPRKLETHTHWEDSDHRPHEEKELPATEAKQGRMGRRVLAMLIVALALTAIVWALAEIWFKAIPSRNEFGHQSKLRHALPLSAAARSI
jgi:hypothetical protein